MIVLDTNVLSELMRATPLHSVVAWVDRQQPTTLYLTALSMAEIRFGIAALPEGKRRETLTHQFEQCIRPLFEDRVLSFDETASFEYASIRANARQSGQAISDYDALIAATAKSHKFEIATRDTTPFEAAGLRVLNPFDG